MFLVYAYMNREVDEVLITQQKNERDQSPPISMAQAWLRKKIIRYIKKTQFC